jgi:peptidoglycan/LPS O-acetylase OafA/YrhL
MTSKQRFETLDGLRMLSVCGVVVAHVVVLLSWHVPYDEYASLLTTSWWGAVYRSAWWAVDVFLLLSGFLLGQAMTTTTSVAALLRHRYTRLIVLYVLVVALGASLGSPQCSRLLVVRELLFASNLFVPAGEVFHSADMCLGVGWTLYVDWQTWLLVIAVATLSNWRKHPRLFEAALWCLILVGVIITAVSTWQLREGLFGAVPLHAQDIVKPGDVEGIAALAEAFGGPLNGTPTRDHPWIRYNPLYFGIQNRFTALVFGVMLHASVTRRESSIFFQILNPGKHLCAPLGLAATLVVAIWFSPTVSFPIVLVVRSLFCLSLCVTLFGLFVCPSDVFSRILNALLGWRVFTWLSPYSYAIYLLHVIVVVAFAQAPIPLFTDSLVLGTAAKVFAISLLLAVPLTKLETYLRSLPSSLLSSSKKTK